MSTIDADNWKLAAACRGLDLGLFFPERGESHEAARAICAGCPVADRCLEAGMFGTARNFGIWGGTSVKERHRIARARRRTSDHVSDEGAVTTASAAGSRPVPAPAAGSLTARTERCPESRSREVRHERRRTPMATTKRSNQKATKPAATGRSKSTITKDGTITCTGACGETLPETKFPTIRNAEGEYVRRDECRACQTTRRAAARAAKAKAAK